MSNLSEILSLGIILLLGFVASFFLNKIRIPGLVGMIIIGLIIGPQLLNLIKDGILNISSEIRGLALVIILTRSGLSLDISCLKKIGRPAVLMSFLPACFEIIGVTLGSIWLLPLDAFEGMVLGSILGAVSPAVVSIRMINLIEKGYGQKHHVPQLVLAGSSLDDIFVIILFYAFLSLVETSSFDALSILGIPISIILGIGIGILISVPIYYILKKTKLDTITYLIIFFSCTLLMKGLESYVDNVTKNTKVDFLSISGLLGVVVLGIVIYWKLPDKAKELSDCYSSLWQFFEIILFVLVGAALKFTKKTGDTFGYGVIVLLIGLVFRSIGVILSIIKTEYTFKERLFIVIAYIPKATVQASIGGIAAAKGLPCGETIEAVSVISIIITAPLGALGMDLLYKFLLEQTTPEVGEKDSIKEIENMSQNENKLKRENSEEVIMVRDGGIIEQNNKNEKNNNEQNEPNKQNEQNDKNKKIEMVAIHNPLHSPEQSHHLLGHTNHTEGDLKHDEINSILHIPPLEFVNNNKKN